MTEETIVKKKYYAAHGIPYDAYNKKLKIFNSNEKDPIIETIKMISYTKSEYGEDYIKTLKIQVKPKYFKWITLYHHEKGKYLEMMGDGPFEEYINRIITCKRIPFKFIIKEIINMIKEDNEALDYFEQYLKSINLKFDIIDEFRKNNLDKNKIETAKKVEKKEMVKLQETSEKKNEKTQELKRKTNNSIIVESGYEIVDNPYRFNVFDKKYDLQLNEQNIDSVRLISYGEHVELGYKHVEKIQFRTHNYLKEPVWKTMWHYENGTWEDDVGDCMNRHSINKVFEKKELFCAANDIISVIQSDLEALKIFGSYLSKDLSSRYVESLEENNHSNKKR